MQGFLVSQSALFPLPHKSMQGEKTPLKWRDERYLYTPECKSTCLQGAALAGVCLCTWIAPTIASGAPSGEPFNKVSLAWVV
jgi:hypothetical protein